jgi:hypothetical protein
MSGGALRCVPTLDVRRTYEFGEIVGTGGLDESHCYTVGLGGSMAQLLVTCPECGLSGERAHGRQELNDPASKCKRALTPARCPSLRVPLLGARRMLEHLEWEAFHAADGEILVPAALIQAPTGAGEVFPTLPLVAQDSEAGTHRRT